MESLKDAAECLKTLAHPHRLRMVQLMLRGRYTVGELAESCDLVSHLASEHLRLMMRCGMLESEREGRKIYYRVAEPALAEIVTCIERRFSKSPAKAGARASRR